MMSKLYIFLALFICYYIFSGINEPFFLITGVFSAALSVYVISKMKLDASYRHLSLKFLRYYPWLLKEVISSTIGVLKIIWSRNLPTEANFATISTKQNTAFGYTVYGNSMTLTPGTVCVMIEDDLNQIVVHALTKQGREDLETGNMDTRVFEALK